MANCAPLALTLLLLLTAADDAFGFIGGNSQVKVSSSGVKVSTNVGDSNAFYSSECSIGVSLSGGPAAGCHKKWKPLFYVVVVAGGLLALLLLSGCCCCCCCAPCRSRTTVVQQPQQQQQPSLIVMPNEASSSKSQPPEYKPNM